MATTHLGHFKFTAYAPEEVFAGGIRIDETAPGLSDRIRAGLFTHFPDLVDYGIRRTDAFDFTRDVALPVHRDMEAKLAPEDVQGARADNVTLLRSKKELIVYQRAGDTAISTLGDLKVDFE